MHCEHKANWDVTKPMYFLIINLYKVILYLYYTYSHTWQFTQITL